MARTLTQAGPERTNRLIFIGAIALAALAAVLVFFALSNFGDDSSSSKDSTASLGATATIVVAARDISAGTTITTEMTELATVSASGTVAGVLTDRATAAGSTTRINLAKGEQLTAAKLGLRAKDRTFSDVVPVGKRAVAVQVDEKSNVGGLVVAGDHVDVIVIGKNKTVNKEDPLSDLPVAFTLLQDIEVLSVSDTALKPTVARTTSGTPIATDDATGNTATRPDKLEPDQTAHTVTLGVNPEQATTLALASQSYVVYLTLRPNGDEGKLANPDARIILQSIQ
jgi:pilus assembly protein CpaB